MWSPRSSPDQSPATEQTLRPNGPEMEAETHHLQVGGPSSPCHQLTSIWIGDVVFCSLFTELVSIKLGKS